jgi:hypothetical protein
MAGQNDAMLAPKQLEQQTYPVVSTRGQENRVETGQGTIDDLYRVACREQVFMTYSPVVSTAGSTDKRFHHARRHGLGQAAEAHEPNHATRRPDGCRVVEPQIHLDK